ncbi:mitochondrial pyruvate dehydrogenase [Mycena olivaceomarginata]|nr:mitochondrial pyruvate dehydrogenase [Mycena olivaceomarginata]
MSAGITPALWNRIRYFGSFPQTRISLQQALLDGEISSQGSILKATQPLNGELPVRLAHGIQELNVLPHNLSAMPSISRVKSWYAQSFEELVRLPARYTPKILLTQGGVSWPPEVLHYNSQLIRAIQTIKRRHENTVAMVSDGILEWRRSHGIPTIGLDMQTWLDQFYMSGIEFQFLIGQYVALNTQQTHPDYVGIICKDTNLHSIAQEAIESVCFACQEHYGMLRVPQVQLTCPENLSFAYVPRHLSHILVFPPIQIIVVEGNEDITIRVSDEGGGIPRSKTPLIWTYTYTTMEKPGTGTDFRFKAPEGRHGYGLPLSRLYARCFGGDVCLISTEGHGTDVYIHLNRLQSKKEALL